MRIKGYADKYGNYREQIILSTSEQHSWFAACANRVIMNTRFVLDNLENFPEFRVNWEDYHEKGYFGEYKRRKNLKKPKGL